MQTYEPPCLTKVGSLLDLTLGGGFGGRDDVNFRFLPWGPPVS